METIHLTLSLSPQIMHYTFRLIVFQPLGLQFIAGEVSHMGQTLPTNVSYYTITETTT